mmetsp:Transcript_57388/g.117498  ORF Transcript_57388/g.117498 Transcript_57388/m.117498 type:complete len:140 (-) Transcript_57388:560-979(-)
MVHWSEHRYAGGAQHSDNVNPALARKQQHENDPTAEPSRIDAFSQTNTLCVVAIISFQKMRRKQPAKQLLCFPALSHGAYGPRLMSPFRARLTSQNLSQSPVGRILEQFLRRGVFSEGAGHTARKSVENFIFLPQRETL